MLNRGEEQALDRLEARMRAEEREARTGCRNAALLDDLARTRREWWRVIDRAARATQSRSAAEEPAF